MKKLMAMMFLITQLISCQPAMARETEAQFDDRMEELEYGIRAYHPEVIWVDVQDVYTVML